MLLYSRLSTQCQRSLYLLTTNCHISYIKDIRHGFLSQIKKSISSLNNCINYYIYNVIIFYETILIFKLRYCL